jgi:glycosyltransferase involved in cell wall biosynthesis
LHPEQVGGAFRYVAKVAERLAARGNRVEVIHPNSENQLAPCETRRGVTRWRYPNARGFFWSNWRNENAAAATLLHERIDAAPATPLVLLCHAFLAPAVGECVRGSQMPRVFLFTGPWAEEVLFSRQSPTRSPAGWTRDFLIATRLRAVERAALAQSQRILTISEYYVRELPRWHPVMLPPIAMISGGVDHAVFRPSPNRERLRAKWQIPADSFALLTVRRLDPRMGLLALIEAFARVRHEHPRAALLIAGRGPQADALAARARELGVDDAVQVLGFVADDELPGLYNAADCTVVPSLALEGFGLVTAESLACGTPVIGSDSGATPELLAPLSTRLLFTSGSVDALADKLREVLGNPSPLPPRATCREFAVRAFNWDRPVAAFENAAQECCGGVR